MSSYARQYLTRPGATFGSQRSGHPAQSRSGGSGGGDANAGRDGARDAEGGNGRSGGGGLSRFAAPRQHHQGQPHHQQRQLQQQEQQQQHQSQRRTAFSHEEIFQEAGGIEHLPINGEIDADDEPRDFSQVTLSQLSDGPSVRSLRSIRSGRVSGNRSLMSQRGGGGEGRRTLARGYSSRESGIGGGSRSLSQSGGRTLDRRSGSGRGGGGGGSGGLNLPGRGRQHPPSQHPSSRGGGRAGERQCSSHQQPRRHQREEAEDDASLRSSQLSQPLLSQVSRPASRGRPGSNGSRAGSSGRGGSSGGRPGAGGMRPSSNGGGRQREQQREGQGRLSQSHRMASNSKVAASSSCRRRRDDDESTTLSPMPPRGPSMGTAQEPSMLRTPLPSSSRRGHASNALVASQAARSGRETRAYPSHSTARTAVRTVGSISHTLASLPTPSRIRTAASRGIAGAASALVSMTPFRKGRMRSSLAPAGSAMGSTLLGSRSMGTVGASGRSTIGGPSRSLFGAALPLSTTPRPPARSTAPRAALASSAARKMPAASSVEGRNAGRDAANVRVEGNAQPSSEMKYHAERAGEGGKQKKTETLASNLRPEPRAGGSDALAETKRPPPAGTEEHAVEGGAGKRMPVLAEKAQEANDGAQKMPSPTAKASVAAAPPVEAMVIERKEATVAERATDEPKNDDAVPAGPNSKEGNDAAGKRHDEKNRDDADPSAATASTLDIPGNVDVPDKVDELAAASNETTKQRELLEESRREFAAETARARKEMREERAKLEELRELVETKFTTLQSAMDAFSARASRSAHEHELALRTLTSQSMSDVSARARGTMEEVSSEVRALAEVETKKRAADAMEGAVAAAKGDLTEFAEGLKGSIAVSERAQAGNDNSPSAEVDETAGDESIISTRNSVVAEKENAVRGREAASSSGGSRTPMRRAGPSRDTSATKSSCPRGGMSTSTTPFTQKSTPLTENRKPSRTHSNNEVALNRDFSAVKSPVSRKKAGKHVLAESDSDADSDSVSVPTRQNLAPARNAKAKMKVTRKAPSSGAKHRSKALVKRSATSPSPSPSAKSSIASPKQSRPKLDGRPAQTASKLKVKITVGQRAVGEAIIIDKPPKTKRETNGQRKRNQSTIDAAKSPRRSKRLKETDRAEQQAIDASNANDTFAKATEVTPKEDTPKESTFNSLAPGGDNVINAQLSAICRSVSSSVARKEDEDKNEVDEGFDSLLGTSVTVPAEDKRQDELIGFDEDEDTQPDRRSLTSLLPFGGFKSRGFGGRSKSKTMSKKKAKKSTFSFDFYG